MNPRPTGAVGVGSTRNGRARRLWALALIASSALVVGAVDRAIPAHAAAPDLSAVQLALTPVASGLSEPVAIAWRSGDQRMYVAEHTGTVRLVETNGVAATTPVLSLTVAQGDAEQGLNGLVFSPDGTKLYVDYTDTTGSIRVSEFTMAGDIADPSTRRDLLTIPHPTYTNHDGGDLVFGPDGDLYIGTGDGGGSGDPNGNAQNLDVLLGKILRINPAPSVGLPYTIPSDNPFVGQAGKRGEIWMYGLRNPWRFSFDRTTGEMWIGDVGQSLYEEVDLAAGGPRRPELGLAVAGRLSPVQRRRRAAGRKGPAVRGAAFERLVCAHRWLRLPRDCDRESRRRVRAG